MLSPRDLYWRSPVSTQTLQHSPRFHKTSHKCILAVYPSLSRLSHWSCGDNSKSDSWSTTAHIHEVCFQLEFLQYDLKFPHKLLYCHESFYKQLCELVVTKFNKLGFSSLEWGGERQNSNLNPQLQSRESQTIALSNPQFGAASRTVLLPYHNYITYINSISAWKNYSNGIKMTQSIKQTFHDATLQLR